MKGTIHATEGYERRNQVRTFTETLRVCMFYFSLEDLVFIIPLWDRCPDFMA